MKRRLLLLLVSVCIVIAVAAWAHYAQQQKPAAGELLLLQWAKKAKMDMPPVAILIEMGLKDTEPTDWSGKATVTGAKVVRREGYRFRDDDKLIEPDGWQAKSRRPIRVPRNNPAVAKQEGIASVGVVFHLADVKPDATLTVHFQDKPIAKTELAIKELLTGEREEIGKGIAVARLVSTALPLVMEKTEDDFPAAAYGPDGTLWVAYISYHVKDDTRRIEAAQLKEQPASFKNLYTPEFGDQLFVKYFRDGKWSEPIAVTGPNEDLVRCAIAVEGDGTAWVAYSANRNGRYDVFIRPISPKLSAEAKGQPSPRVGPEEKLTDAGDPSRLFTVLNLSPVMTTSAEGKLFLAHQTWQHAGSVASAIREHGQWKRHGVSGAGNDLRAGGGHANLWNPTLAAGPNGEVVQAHDFYGDGDYGIFAQLIHPHSAAGSVASSDSFEARPSICFDAKGRLWLAYEEGPSKWGKDYGAFDLQDGNPLYNSRSVRVVCAEFIERPNGRRDVRLFRPVAELPSSSGWEGHPEIGGRLPLYERALRYAYPKIGIDGKGRVWLTYRQKFGSRYSTHPGSYWLTFARRLDGDKWSEPIELHHSCGLLDHRPVLLPHPAGGLLVIHNTDGRYTTPERIDNDIYISYLDLPPASGGPGGVEPKLVPHDPGKKDEKLVAEAKAEREAVQRCRDYRIEAAGKKYQLLRGEFHRHTELSWDGGPDGSLEDMFRYAIDAAAMDWIGNGDHDNGAGREYSWWLTQKFTDAYHVKNVFTPMFTYERSVAYPHGHRNCVFARRGVRTLPRLAAPPAPEGQKPAPGGVHPDDTKMLYRYLKEMDGICASHTCATGMGTDWRDNDPLVEPIVEIYQGDRMSYEYEGCPRAGYDPKGGTKPFQIGGWQPAGFLDKAFGKGYRLGFQASSDHWSTHISYCIVLAERHDREAILDAMKKRHVYGATDNIILDVRSGTHIQGDEFKTDAPPKLEFNVIGTKPIRQIDILKDSKVVETIKPGKQEHKGAWTDPNPAKGTHYYYVRVIQEDEEIAWGSPMWIEYSK